MATLIPMMTWLGKRRGGENRFAWHSAVPANASWSLEQRYVGVRPPMLLASQETSSRRSPPRN